MQKKRAAKDAEGLKTGRHADNAKVADSRDELAQVLRDKILSQVHPRAGRASMSRFIGPSLSLYTNICILPQSQFAMYVFR